MPILNISLKKNQIICTDVLQRNSLSLCMTLSDHASVCINLTPHEASVALSSKKRKQRGPCECWGKKVPVNLTRKCIISTLLGIVCRKVLRAWDHDFLILQKIPTTSKPLFRHLIFLAPFCLTLLTGGMLRSVDSKQGCIYEGNALQVPKPFSSNEALSIKGNLICKVLTLQILFWRVFLWGLLGLFLLFLNHMCVSVCGSVHTSAGASEGQRVWTPWSWRYRGYEPPHVGFRNRNVGPGSGGGERL